MDLLRESNNDIEAPIKVMEEAGGYGSSKKNHLLPKCLLSISCQTSGKNQGYGSHRSLKPVARFFWLLWLYIRRQNDSALLIKFPNERKKAGSCGPLVAEFSSCIFLVVVDIRRLRSRNLKMTGIFTGGPKAKKRR